MPENLPHPRGRGHNRVFVVALSMCQGVVGTEGWSHLGGHQWTRTWHMGDAHCGMSQSCSKQRGRCKTSNTCWVRKGAAQITAHHVHKKNFHMCSTAFTRTHSYSETGNRHPRVGAYGRGWREGRKAMKPGSSWDPCVEEDLRSKTKASCAQLCPQQCVRRRKGL